jgi:hypothetical protein
MLERQLASPFSGCELRKKEDTKGDAPDYLCASSASDPYLAEAKGTYDSVSFGSKDFVKWRNQFKRVEFRNAVGQPESLKGFIVATRFATEKKPNFHTTLYAEDPQSPGREPLGERSRRELGAAVIEVHYGHLAERLNQPILSASLRTGFQAPEEIIFNAIVWQIVFPSPLQGTRFVGGYHPSIESSRFVEVENGEVQFYTKDPLQLGRGRGTFIGVKESVFKQMVGNARRRAPERFTMEALPPTPPFYSAISLLRDGSIVGPVEFFRAVEPLTL